MRTVTEFNISVIVVTKMITYKFPRGVLLRMHDQDQFLFLGNRPRF